VQRTVAGTRKEPGRPLDRKRIFRSAHTLKGMSATMGYEDLANLTHNMENVLDAIRNSQIALSPELFDVIFLAVDALEAMVMSIAEVVAASAVLEKKEMIAGEYDECE